MGPTGSGKSLLARRIYQLKKAKRQIAGNFVELNCATLRGDAAMSALFGHTKGAFTGAVAARPGLLRAADNGILFLDEIGELGRDEQAMLLRALEEKTFLPVGSDTEAHSNFQLLAGTNQDLAREVAAGNFREDLFARINLWTFRLPALRDRKEDLEPNMSTFELTEFSRIHGSNVTFNKEAREKFLTFARSPDALWTANFRDLNATINRPRHPWPSPMAAPASPPTSSPPSSPPSAPPGLSCRLPSLHERRSALRRVRVRTRLPGVWIVSVQALPATRPRPFRVRPATSPAYSGGITHTRRGMSGIGGGSPILGGDSTVRDDTLDLADFLTAAPARRAR